jgi:hypothetical protein
MTPPGPAPIVLAVFRISFVRKENEEIPITDTYVISIRADQALKTRARLIGRQMAREQLEANKPNRTGVAISPKRTNRSQAAL